MLRKYNFYKLTKYKIPPKCPPAPVGYKGWKSSEEEEINLGQKATEQYM